ncbi:MAG: DUF2298 domain-containing protein [Chloroflexota bacterium]
MTDAEAILRWLGVVLAFAAAGLPLARLLLPSGGFAAAALAPPVGVLAGVFPAWFAAAAFGVPYSTAGLWASLAIVSAVGGAALARRVRGGAPGQGAARSVLPALGVVVAGFASGVWLRGFTPDLTGTEKPMDIAFLASSMRTISMPPPDPWFAGEAINYYHLGYVLFGAVGRMAGVAPWVAFNLAVPTVLAMGLAGAAAAGWTLVRPWRGARAAAAGAAATAFLVMIAGNLYAPWRLLADFTATRDAWWWDGARGIGWHSSRIVCDGPRAGAACAFPSVETINEFPFFSVLLGDLHPHLMALPFALATIAAAAGLALAGPGVSIVSWRLRIAALGALAGSLYAINSWDLPTCLAAAALLLAVTQRSRGRAIAGDLGTLAAGALLPWLPFWLRFDPPTNRGALGPLSAVAPHVGERTSIGEFLTVFGVLAPLAGLAVWSCWAAAGKPLGARAAGALAAGAVLAIALQAPVLLIAAIGAGAAALALHRQRGTGETTVPAALAMLGFALLAAVELFYLRDVFESRLNTLFKVFYQVWVLFGVSGGAAAVLLATAARRRAARLAWAGAAAAVAAALLVYPLLASWQWIRDWPWSGDGSWRGLNGLAYAEESYPGEAAGIRWLNAHARPGDVVAEAPGCSYFPVGDLPTNRFSAHTGAPAVIGWPGHERQWRAGQPGMLDQIAPRGADLVRIYAEPGGPLPQAYDVRWLVRGRYETGDWSDRCDTAGPYPGIDAPGWPGPGWTLAFEQDGVAIYERR